MRDFSKALFKAGFAITRLEEWVSHKQSQKGPRQRAEDTARFFLSIPSYLEQRINQLLHVRVGLCTFDWNLFSINDEN